MIFDVLSDLHFDAHFIDPVNTSKKQFQKKFDPLFRDKAGEVLIIAGDLGHFNDQIMLCLGWLKKLYYPEGEIVCVLGNHDYHLNARTKRDFETPRHRAQDLRDRINAQDGMHCLDGNIISIGDVKIGGCDSWYDDVFAKKYFPHTSKKYLMELWEKWMPDPLYMPDLEDYIAMSDSEKEKIDRIYRDVDIMVTHVNPSLNNNGAYERSEISNFYHFDGHRYLEEGNMKYWIFGHSHDKQHQFTQDGVTLITNALGSDYYDVKNARLMSFEITKEE